jgi:hypothetical protein
MNKMARQSMAAGMTCLLLCCPAWANPGNGADHAARMQQKEARQEARQEAREARLEAHDQRGDARKKAGRLTPEERRALRRQINEAGQDLYQTPQKN